MSIILHGYKYSVYNRIVLMVLAEKAIEYRRVEVDPFADEISGDYLALQPFNRVPTLVDRDFVLYETGAIIRYLDEAFPGPSLQPDTPQSRARMTQIISIVDAYAYWPMVRQVFSQRVFNPLQGIDSDEQFIADGIESSARVLAALESIAEEGHQLDGRRVSLADLHLAPMIAYFTLAAEGSALFGRFPKLSAWWQLINARDSLHDTKPQLPGFRKDLK